MICAFGRINEPQRALIRLAALTTIVVKERLMAANERTAALSNLQLSGCGRKIPSCSERSGTNRVTWKSAASCYVTP